MDAAAPSGTVATQPAADTTAELPRGAWLIALTAVLCGLLYVLVLCAWQCDDAYITFRTVHNAARGEGFTWNPGERVQAYTHPAWMLLSLAAYALTHELFVTMNVVAIVVSLGGALGFVALAGRSSWWTFVLLATWCASKAFVDYSVCGLENPLLNLCLIAAAAATMPCAGRRSLRHDLALPLTAAAVFLSRPDAVLLIAPACLHVLGRERIALRRLVLGAAPAWAWEAFSLVYYGSLVPNTALAKLNVSVPRGRLLAHGMRYFADSLARDPITLIAIAIAIGWVVVRGTTIARALVAGVVIYLVYVIVIGGDFMSGRFLGAPLVVASTAVVSTLRSHAATRARASNALAAAALASVIAYSLLWPGSPVRSTPRYGLGVNVDIHFVSDERAVYYPTTGLLPVLPWRSLLLSRGIPVPPHLNAIAGLEFGRGPRAGIALEQIGLFAYFADHKEIVDVMALADPLLARIPFRLRTKEDFRPGHCGREIPPGYGMSRRVHENRITDPELHRAYEAIRVVVSGPLFTARRWVEIWRLNTGYYRHAFEAAARR